MLTRYLDMRNVSLTWSQFYLTIRATWPTLRRTGVSWLTKPFLLTRLSLSSSNSALTRRALKRDWTHSCSSSRQVPCSQRTAWCAALLETRLSRGPQTAPRAQNHSNNSGSGDLGCKAIPKLFILSFIPKKLRKTVLSGYPQQ